jgi:hypothetical protein
VASDDPAHPGAGAEGEPPEPKALESAPPVVRTRGRLVWIGAFLGTIALVAGLLALLGGDDKPDANAALKAAQHVVETSDSYRFELHDITHSTTGDPGGAGTDTTSRDVTTANVAAADTWHVVETTSDAADVGFGSGPTELVRVGDTGWVRGGDFQPGGSASPPWNEVQVPDHPMTVDDYVAQYTQLEAAFAEASTSGADSSTTTVSGTDAPPTTTVASADGGNAVTGSFFGADDPEQLLGIAVAAYVLPVAEDPANLKRLVEAATDPVVEEQLADGGVRLRTRLVPIPAMAKLVKQPLPPVDVLLDLDGSNRPTVARFTAKVKDASRDVEVRYSGWDTPIRVSAPDDAQVDHTPWIAEEDLAKLDSALRLAPSVLPGDHVLTSADVYNDTFMDDAGHETDESCASLELEYGTKAEYDHALAHVNDDPLSLDSDPFYDSIGYLSVSVSTSHCASQYQDEITYDKVLGGHPAQISSEEGTIYVQLGDVVVEIDTSLDAAQLDGLVRSIRPVTIDELAASIPSWAKEDGPDGPYGYGWPTGPGFLTGF